jgi:hypothetical protein
VQIAVSLVTTNMTLADFLARLCVIHKGTP